MSHKATTTDVQKYLSPLVNVLKICLSGAELSCFMDHQVLERQAFARLWASNYPSV